MTEPDVVVVGSSNTDLVIECPKLPGPGETVLGGPLRASAGGKGANQAVAAARAGARVAFLGAHGGDSWGAAAREGLSSEGIQVEHFLRVPGAGSGVALILVGGAERQNCIAVARSANQALRPGAVRAAGDLIRRARVLLVQLEIPLETVDAALEFADRHGVYTVLNPAPFRPLPETMIRRVRCIVPNQGEAERLTGSADPEIAGRRLAGMGIPSVAITAGAAGAYCLSADGSGWIEAPRVKAVDTVGAGDCFCGWLAAGLARDRPFPQSVERAVRAAALSVTRTGAQSAMPRAREVPERPAM